MPVLDILRCPRAQAWARFSPLRTFSPEVIPGQPRALNTLYVWWLCLCLSSPGLPAAFQSDVQLPMGPPYLDMPMSISDVSGDSGTDPVLCLDSPCRRWCLNSADGVAPRREGRRRNPPASVVPLPVADLLSYSSFSPWLWGWNSARSSPDSTATSSCKCFWIKVFLISITPSAFILHAFSQSFVLSNCAYFIYLFLVHSFKF